MTTTMIVTWGQQESPPAKSDPCNRAHVPFWCVEYCAIQAPETMHEAVTVAKQQKKHEIEHLLLFSNFRYNCWNSSICVDGRVRLLPVAFPWRRRSKFNNDYIVSLVEVKTRESNKTKLKIQKQMKNVLKSKFCQPLSFCLRATWSECHLEWSWNRNECLYDSERRKNNL